MKKTALLLIISILSISKCMTQNLCSNEHSLNKNTSFKITAYGTNNNLIAVTNYEVASIYETLNGKKTLLEVVNKESSKEKPVLEKSKFELICTGESLILNYPNIIPAYIYDEYSNMEFDISRITLEIPTALTIGQKLEDAEFDLDIIVTPIKQKLRYFLTDRCVTGKEIITTPAGSFDCYVIESKTHMRPENKNTGFVKQYFSEGIGFVKQIDYNKTGEVSSINVLTEIEL